MRGLNTVTSGAGNDVVSPDGSRKRVAVSESRPLLRAHGRRKRKTAQFRVAIVGAGVGGVAAAVKLQQAGFRDFVVFEQARGPGGTWYDNVYPGCSVDVASEVYSFSFMPYDWPRTHATQPELLQYIDHTIDHFGIREHFRFNSRVDSAVWDESQRVYVVRTADGHVGKYNLLVSGSAC